MFNGRSVHWPLAARKIWRAALVMLMLVVPLALATTAPGIAVAAWLTSLKITQVWTFVGASSMTAALTIGLGPSRPLKFVWRFVTGFARPRDATLDERAGSSAG